MKLLLLLLCAGAFHTALCQPDTNTIRRLYIKSLDLPETNSDSVEYFAQVLDKSALKLGYKKAKLYALRLHGLSKEYKSEYTSSISYYLQAVEESKLQGNREIEAAVLSDLAIVYTAIKQYEDAKHVYLESIALKTEQDTLALIDTYINLGAIYNNLKQYDSSLYILQKGLQIAEVFSFRDASDFSSLYNNLGNTYFFKREFNLALVYFSKNYDSHSTPDKAPDRWFDCLNIADIFIEENKFDSAVVYANECLKIADQLHSRSRQADTYSMLAKLDHKKGDDRHAFTYLQQWYDLDTALVNLDKAKAVASLQEQYHARERENEKLLLKEEVFRQVSFSRIIIIVAIGLLLVAVLSGWAFITKRDANRILRRTNFLVTAQNKKLADLNYEKNALISIVSHDLGAPFATIGMWAQIFEHDQQSLNDEQKKAVAKISEATVYGQRLIRRILDVEKLETSIHQSKIEHTDLSALAREAFDGFEVIAKAKDIRLLISTPPDPLMIMSDGELIGRIFYNLLSNAIKFSGHGKSIQMIVEKSDTTASIKVIDEGIGIKEEEQQRIFSKYGNISSRPTDGEPSTGIGLSIVKSIVDELTGTITCESSQGHGTRFTVTFNR